jgi:outer membrane receptor protein involved in Fe transport
MGVPIAGFNPPVPVHAESSETDPMVSLSYQLNDQIMLYTTYQEGFRGGGTTARPTATTRVPFGPETLANFEIGMKSDLLDRRLRLNVTLFDMSYEDMQIGTAGQDQFGQAAWVTSNDGEASIRGVEIEVNSTIGEHWFVDGTFGNTDFQYSRVPTLADCLAKGFPASSCTGRSSRHFWSTWCVAKCPPRNWIASNSRRCGPPSTAAPCACAAAATARASPCGRRTPTAGSQ